MMFFLYPSPGSAVCAEAALFTDDQEIDAVLRGVCGCR